MMTNKLRVALAGNPNVGKTSIFNIITGTRQHVGNWPGVTVEKKSGERKVGDTEIEFVDLPGTYSLSAFSLDEKVARDFIIEEKPDVVVHIVDATNLERNLYLTTQLIELGVKIIVALNMSDLANKKGTIIDTDKLSELLNVSVVKTVGNTGDGVNKLLDTIVDIASKPHSDAKTVSYGNNIESSIKSIKAALEKDSSLKSKYPLRWLSLALLENDEGVQDLIENSSAKSEVDTILDSIDADEFETAIPDKRYSMLRKIVSQSATRSREKVSQSEIMDRVLTDKYLGIPIFLALMWGAFELTFTAAGPFMDIIDTIAGSLADSAKANIGTEWLASVVGDGIIAGVGAVIIFLPNIMIMFFILAMLEASGYLARAAFIVDKIMYKLGMHGKSFIPMLMGFGCTVPAVMSTRTIEDEKDRLLTILVAPFMSCGARLPVYVLLAGAFFATHAGSIIWGLYVFGIVVAILSAALLRKFVIKGEPAPFVMELPPYRQPTLKACLLHMWDKGSLYLKKAGTLILAGAILVWFLASYPVGVEYGSEASYAGQLGHLLEPLFRPLGFDWRIAVALFFGFLAKEVVVGSLGVLYAVGEDEAALTAALQADPTFSPTIAMGLMVFTLLYLPCVAVIGVMKKEMGSWKWVAFSILYSTIIAWIAAFIVIHGGQALGFA